MNYPPLLAFSRQPDRYRAKTRQGYGVRANARYGLFSGTGCRECPFPGSCHPSGNLRIMSEMFALTRGRGGLEPDETQDPVFWCFAVSGFLVLVRPGGLP